MISIEEFRNKYIEIDFDELLREQNSIYINSNQTYLEYKSHYITLTNNNFKEFKQLIDMYNNCSKNKTTIDSKNIYKYICPKKKEMITTKVHDILKIQNENYTNLMSHINFILSI